MRQIVITKPGQFERVATHAAIAVPREVGEPFLHAGRFHSTVTPSLSVLRLADTATGARSDRARTRGSPCERAQARARRGAQHAAQHRVAVHVTAPPRHLVALACLVAQHVGVFEETGDLVGGEHLAHEHVPAGGEEVADVVGARADVGHGERRGRVQPVQVDAVRVVHGATVVHRAERRLPAHEPERVAADDLDPAAVQQAGRGIEVAGQPAPRFVVECDDRLRGVFAHDDLDRVVGRHVGERARRRANRERPDLAGVAGGERSVAGDEPPGKDLAMEAIELDRIVDRRVVQARVNHGETVLTPGSRRCVTVRRCGARALAYRSIGQLSVIWSTSSVRPSPTNTAQHNVRSRISSSA